MNQLKYGLAVRFKHLELLAALVFFMITPLRVSHATESGSTPTTTVCASTFKPGTHARTAIELQAGQSLIIQGLTGEHAVQTELGRGFSRIVYEVRASDDSGRTFALSAHPRNALGSDLDRLEPENRSLIVEGTLRYNLRVRDFLSTSHAAEHQMSPYVRLELFPVEAKLLRSEDAPPQDVDVVLTEIATPVTDLLVRREALTDYTRDELKARLVLIEQLSQAIRWYEDHDIDHLDIKLSNVMIVGRPNPTLDDLLDGRANFALADQQFLRIAEGQFVRGEVFGTPLAMSPEQILGEPIRAVGMAFSVGIAALQTVWSTDRIRSTFRAGARGFSALSLSSLRSAISLEFGRAALDARTPDQRELLLALKNAIFLRLSPLAGERELLPLSLRTSDAQLRHRNALESLRERRARFGINTRSSSPAQTSTSLFLSPIRLLLQR